MVRIYWICILNGAHIVFTPRSHNSLKWGGGGGGGGVYCTALMKITPLSTNILRFGGNLQLGGSDLI